MSKLSDYFAVGSPARGEAVFLQQQNGAAINWTVPAGVTSISILCVGSGAAGIAETAISSGGGGGGLAWVNNISVASGDVLAVTTGRHSIGTSNQSYRNTRPDGEDSLVVGASTLCKASGGWSGVSTSGFATRRAATGGSAITGSGGTGGTGGYISTAYSAGSGGGSGGYSGAGGAGVSMLLATFDGGVTGNTGSGGGGGSGGVGTQNDTYLQVGGSGGVGVLGEGSNGIGGACCQSSTSQGGKGGSGGLDGENPWWTWRSYGLPSSSDGFGAGGSFYRHSSAAESVGNDGGPGIVRILWGDGRSFPSTDVGQS